MWGYQTWYGWKSKVSGNVLLIILKRSGLQYCRCTCPRSEKNVMIWMLFKKGSLLCFLKQLTQNQLNLHKIYIKSWLKKVLSDSAMTSFSGPKCYSENPKNYQKCHHLNPCQFLKISFRVFIRRYDASWWRHNIYSIHGHKNMDRGHSVRKNKLLTSNFHQMLLTIMSFNVLIFWFGRV